MRMFRAVGLLIFALTLVLQASSKEFVIKDIAGKVYHITPTKLGLNIKELKNKIVFLGFFGHNCPPCMIEIPEFIEFTKNKKYAKDAVIFAIEVQGLSTSELKDFAKIKGMNYIVASGEDHWDFVSFITKKTGWRGSIPFMVVLDQKGSVVTYGMGMIGKKDLTSTIKQLHSSQD